MLFFDIGSFLVRIVFFLFSYFDIQSNLSIVDMLYNGYLVTADIFLRNQPNHSQTRIEKPLYSGCFNSGYLL